MELKNIHRGSDAYMVLSLTNDGVRIDFSTMEDIVVATYADSQKAFAGKCEILSIEGTAMRVKSPAKAQRFVGAQRLVLTCTYDGRTASYDAPAFNVVATSAEVDSQGMTAEQENADIGIDLKVEDVTSSLVQEIVSAAVKSTDEAHSASLAALAQAERAGVSADEADKSSVLAQQKATLAATKASDAEAAATRANEAVATINGKFAEQDKFISDTINEQNEQIQTKFAEQDKHVANKAEVDGRYPEMSVGFADDLVGRGESVPAEFSFRASGGKSIKDGAARIKRLKGNSVVWNQLWDINGDNSTDNVANMTINEGEVVLTIQDRGKNSRIRTAYTIGVVGHKYYVTYQAKYNSKSDDSSLIAFVGMSNFYGNQLPLTNSYQTYSRIWVGDYAGSMTVGIIGTRNDGDIVSFKDIKVIDLTQMFQAGNDPTTIEEFNARKPIVADEYAYNEGQVIHCNTESIKSVGDNAWDEEWIAGRLNTNTGQPNLGNNGITSKNYIRVLPNETYYCGYNAASIFAMFYDAEYALITGVKGSNNYVSIRNTQFTTPANSAYMKFYVADDNLATYNNDILISLYHSGWKAQKDDQYQPYWQDILPLPIISKYFPDGMKSAGTVHDEIRFNKASGKWEYSKGKIKSVDLGSMVWSLYGSGFSSESLEHLANAPTTYGSPSPIICGRYSTKNVGHSTTWADTDKVCYMSYDGRGVVFVNDSAYTDAATFKADMAGVILYYESNDWEWVELDKEDQNFNLDYRVADFGTEQAIAETNSAPISADIIYQFNAVDMIREHELEIAELQSIIATMQAQLASLPIKNKEADL